MDWKITFHVWPPRAGLYPCVSGIELDAKKGTKAIGKNEALVLRGFFEQIQYF